MYALLGHPVAHSMSPAMHNRAFSELKIDAKYVTIDVTEDELPEVVLQLKDMGYRGWNLTMPCKSAMVPYCDELSRAAKLCGAVNTIELRDGSIIGHTTDGLGYTDSLKYEGNAPEGIKGHVITILGCGGAARSIIVQAAIDGAKRIHVCKRKNASFDEAVAFCWQVKEETGTEIDVIDIGNPTDYKHVIDDADVLTNATNVGMAGVDLSSPVPKEYLRQDLLVSDIIYHPLMTQLLKDAKETGAEIHSGQWMLLYQGAAAFNIWTKRQMPIGAVKEVFAR